MRSIPARLRNAGSWAWHAGTAAQVAAVLLALLVPRLAGLLASGVVLAVAAWKGERRKAWRAARELEHLRDNAAWLTAQLDERTQELRKASAMPAPVPPRLATLTVQAPRTLGPPVPDEGEWPLVPLVIRADSPHDPATVVIAARLPAGAPWHTES